MMQEPNRGPRRVVLAHTGRLLGELFKRAIERSPHLQLVDKIGRTNDLISRVAKTDAQWVVMSLAPDGSIPEVAQTLLSKYPSVCVLAVASDGSALRLGWTEPREKPIAAGSNGSPIRLRWTEPRDRLLDNLSLEQVLSILRKGELWESAVGQDQ